MLYSCTRDINVYYRRPLTTPFVAAAATDACNNMMTPTFTKTVEQWARYVAGCGAERGLGAVPALHVIRQPACQASAHCNLNDA